MWLRLVIYFHELSVGLQLDVSGGTYCQALAREKDDIGQKGGINTGEAGNINICLEVIDGVNR